MKMQRAMLSAHAFFILLGFIFSSTQAVSAGSEGYLGEGSTPHPTGSQRIATKEDIEKMRKTNEEISAGFSRIDSLFKDIISSRSKIKQVISNHQELALCVALQQAHNEASNIERINTPLSVEQKQILTEYQKIHAELATDIRKGGIRCPSTTKP